MSGLGFSTTRLTCLAIVAFGVIGKLVHFFSDSLRVTHAYDGWCSCPSCRAELGRQAERQRRMQFAEASKRRRQAKDNYCRLEAERRRIAERRAELLRAQANEQPERGATELHLSETWPRIGAEERRAAHFTPPRDGSEWRAKASESARLRDDYNAKGESAYNARSTSEARMYREKAREYRELMEQQNAEAATEIFAHHNPSYDPGVASTLKRCDLHRLHTREAERYVTDHVQACQQAGLTETVIITGRGKGSKDGDPKLKPAIAELLKSSDFGVHVGVPNDGCIKVKFEKLAGV